MLVSESRNIWYVHPYAGGPGIGRYDRPFHLARHWKNLGHSSVILCPSQHHLLDSPRDPGVKEIQGVTYEFLRSPSYNGNGFGRIINMVAFTAELIRNGTALAERHGRPSMIIASSPHPYAYLAARHLAIRFGAQCVFEVRDLWPLSLVELADVKPSHPLVRATAWLERHAYRSANAVVSLLPCTRAHMIPLGVDEQRWHYIPNGIEPETNIEPSTTHAFECINLARQWRNEGRTVIVYSGALGAPNYVESLINAISERHKQGSNASAIIVGRGERQNELRKRVDLLNMQENIAIFSQIPKAAVLTLLNESSAGYISLKPEPLFRFGVSPNKLFDYMLASLPVIFAIRAGNDPVTEAGCGVTVDPEDTAAIARAIAIIEKLPEHERTLMGQRGRTYVLKNHSYSKLAETYLRLLEPRI